VRRLAISALEIHGSVIAPDEERQAVGEASRELQFALGPSRPRVNVDCLKGCVNTFDSCPEKAR
jgi:hypothetical protein